jgi:signal peptidase II
MQSTISTLPPNSAVASRATRQLGLGLAVLTVIADQLSKWFMLEIVFAERNFVPVTGFFNLARVHNRGASFGMFALSESWGPWLLSGIAVVISVVLAVWLWRANGRWLATALGLILGGAIGNLIDRARYGAVTDFLDFYVGTYHWPAFNLADSAITVGVVMLIGESLIAGRRSLKV